MSTIQFEKLLCLVGPVITKENTVREPISAIARLLITLSIVLLAICDANYSFTFIDIGAHGQRSDGGIFRDSAIGQNFAKREMNIPDPARLTVDGMPLPYVLVGDEAFQLRSIP
ncbi:hypothetical protein NQ318_019964 [Aromia moschata]|uniref:DDE Tnp4 domain-containing protein n=1 Tax=Aromia moschata TaxID=1265417 RepID=A0AAV8Y6J2_9CUCU|nr:hypothetical protein NQ318_019964 [Aromia moschata]